MENLNCSGNLAVSHLKYSIRCTSGRLENKLYKAQHLSCRSPVT